jgi:hypothetical protein
MLGGYPKFSVSVSEHACIQALVDAQRNADATF